MRSVRAPRAEDDPQLRRDDRRAPRKVPLRLVALVLLTGGLIALSVLISLPFLHAITWGVALAIIAWPVHTIIRARIASPSFAAWLSTTIVLLLIVVPGVFVIYQVGREVEAIAQKSQTPPEDVVSRENLTAVPGARRVVV